MGLEGSWSVMAVAPSAAVDHSVLQGEEVMRVARARARNRKATGAPTPVRTVRVDDETWEAAKVRAEQEDVTVSYVVVSLIEGYGLGLIDLPKVEVVYTQPREAVPEAV